MEHKPEGLNAISEDRRESFRIDDSLPVMICKVEDLESTLTLEAGLEDLEGLSPSVLQAENISLYLWKMLCNINKKLDLVLEKLPVDLSKTKARMVSLSSTGMKIVDKKNFQVAQEVRIKILLPTLPSQEVLVSGKVVRVKALKNGEYEVALHFDSLDETVKGEIIQFILKQQRKVISARRNQRNENGRPHETKSL